MLTTKRVFLIDDHPIIRSALNAMLQNIPILKVIGEAGSGWEGVKLARNLKPDLVVLDFKLPDISGLEVTQQLLKSNPLVKILILTSEEKQAPLPWLLSAGAHGYIEKSASHYKIKEAMLRVLESQPPPPNYILKTPSSLKELTLREIEILRLTVLGNNTRMIAQKLHIQKKTIYTYRSSIYKKLAAKNIVDLIRFALQHKLVSIEELHCSEIH